MNLPKEFENTSIAIVGTGYIGNRLANAFGHYQKSANLKIQTFNRTSLNLLKNATFDFVFNCSGNTGDFRNQIWETLNSNLNVNQFIFENAKINKCLILLSSSRIYGFTNDPNNIFEENDFLSESNKIHLGIDYIYNGTKMLMESVAMNLATKSSYKIVICRLSNVFGNYSKNDLDDSTYLKLMLRHKIENKPFSVNQNIDSTKGYIYIDDAISGVILSAAKSETSGIYNICSGKSYSIKDWLEKLSVNYTLNKEEQTESTHSKISIKKAQIQLGYNPQYYLENLNLNQIIQP